jgi:small subunit ribosomal protein S2
MWRHNRKKKGKDMAVPVVTLKELFEAGVHYGHKTRSWNPKMHSYIFGVRSGVHIIDLEQTVPLFQRALQQLRDTAASGGRVLFVGTKRQAQEKIAETAKRSGQYYVNHRWLGGMLTNWKTISQSIKRLRELEEKLEISASKFTKKEILDMTRDHEKLERALGGIKDMGGVPDILFVIDSCKESLAIEEAVKLGIPVISILDTNSDPDKITFPVPGNDDASRSINLYCDLAAQAILDGIEAEVIASGKDVGASAQVPASETSVA